MYVLLADSQATECVELRQLFELDSELCLVDETSEVGDLLARVQTTHLDVVLLEWELSGLEGDNPVSVLRCLVCPPKVVAFGEHPEARREALAAGVDAFVSKEQPVEELLNTVRAVGRLSPCFV
jgi:DNA-binding NarL/FixJ family response regulator